MTKLHISSELALPLSFVTSTQAILAKKRVGKSYTAQVEAEELLEANQQVVVIDPTGAWYGLRSSPDGRSTGYPISIIGGKHGDAPLELDSGARWAEAIVSDRFSAIFDISLFDDVDWSRFIAEFLSTLYRLNESAMHLFIDEADVACPQTAQDKAQQKALRATNNIVRRGGLKGIGCTLISQRPALIDKSVLYMIDQLVVLQMNGELDLKQIKGWVKAHDLSDDVGEMISSLPSLPKGDAWVWAPNAGIFKRVTIRRKHTFDSGRTPEPGEAAVAAKVLAPVDVKRLGKSIASAVERAAANDPAALRKRIAELEARKSGSDAPPRVVEKRIITDEELRRLEAVADKCDALSKRIDDTGNELHEVLEVLTGEVIDLRAAIHLADQLPNGEPVKTNRQIASEHFAKDGKVSKQVGKYQIRVPAPKPSKPAPAPKAESTLDSGTLLNAIATLHNIELATFPALAAWLGMHPRNKTLLTAIGQLRSDGLLDGLQLTGNGAAVARPTKPSGTDQREQLRRPLSEGQQHALDMFATFEKLGRAHSHAALAAWLGVHPRNKGLLTDIGFLRDRGYLADSELTEIGRRASLPAFAGVTAGDIIAYLDESARPIVRLALKLGSVVDMTALATALDLHPRNKGLLTDLGKLRERGLITNDWPLKPTSVFPGVAS